MLEIYDKHNCLKYLFCLPIVQNTRDYADVAVDWHCRGAVLNRIVLPSRPTILPWSYPQVSLEGLSKRRDRIVACGGRDDAQLVTIRAQPRGSYIEPEARKVAEWRLTNQLREPGREGGTREGYAVCELRNGPWLLRLVMEQDQRSADLLIPQGSQPSGLGDINIFIQIVADNLHEQNVGQSCDNCRSTTASRAYLLKDMADRYSEPRGGVFASPLEMDEGRKNRKKRVGRAILGSHSATHQSRDRSLATGAKRTLFVRNVSLEKVEIINYRSCWQIPDKVRVTSRYDYEITGGQLYRLSHA